MTTIDGAVTIVTGASRGIGVELAKALAFKGARLALTARSAAELQAVCDSLTAAGHTAIAIPGDVANADDRVRLLARTTAELGPIDILVNNAGIETSRPFAEMDDGDITRILDVNLHAPALLTRAVLPSMIDRGRGHVVNISSAAGKMGPPFIAAYAASKHGLVGLTHSLRAEHHGSNIGFSVICPAFVTRTGMYARWEDQGVRAPRLAGTAKVQKVVVATIHAIEKNKVEVLVNTPPLRPLVVLGAAFPRIVPRTFKLFGYHRTLQRAAQLPQP